MQTRWSWCLPSLSSNTALPVSKWLRDRMPGLLELHQDAVDRRQADVGVLGEQDAKDVLGVMWRCVVFWKTSEHLDARQRRLQAAVLQFFGMGHGRRGGRRAQGRAGRIDPSYELGARRRACANDPTTTMTTRLPAPVAPPACLAPAPLAGCQSLQISDSFLGVITPYRIEVVQGNVITSEQVALAKPGLTRAQVRDVLGSPLLADPFHADRWDYVFTIRRQGAEPQLRRVVVRFKADVLAQHRGRRRPAERARVRRLDRHLQDRARTAPRSLSRGADQGTAGAGAPPPARAGPAGAEPHLPAARAPSS